MVTGHCPHAGYFGGRVPNGGGMRERILPEAVRQVGLLYDRWRHHLSPPPHFTPGTGREGSILQPPALVISSVTTHKTFGPTD
ncbi:hypothetical protein TNCV_2793051 [Trichonephila clavipes]|nr:hypothetical protein TNCV_2793051 [Trichonephila clavipes]